MAEMLTHSLGPRVSARTEVADGTPPAAVDGNRPEMALLNLAVNARDVTQDDGTLAFTAGPHRSDGSGSLPAGDFARVAVSDTGVGMDAATLEKAAEPFFTTKEVGAGTGFGLSMIHGLAERSGGGWRRRVCFVRAGANRGTGGGRRAHRIG